MVLAVLATVLSACSHDPTWTAIEQEPIAQLQPNGLIVVDRIEQQGGSALGKPVRPTLIITLGGSRAAAAAAVDEIGSTAQASGWTSVPVEGVDWRGRKTLNGRSAEASVGTDGGRVVLIIKVVE